jgi:hypothetical protein
MALLAPEAWPSSSGRTVDKMSSRVSEVDGGRAEKALLRLI